MSGETGHEGGAGQDRTGQDRTGQGGRRVRRPRHLHGTDHVDRAMLVRTSIAVQLRHVSNTAEPQLQPLILTVDLTEHSRATATDTHPDWTLQNTAEPQLQTLILTVDLIEHSRATATDTHPDCGPYRTQPSHSYRHSSTDAAKSCKRTAHHL
ncbi:hypothetical protein ACOMHN_036315 [Nucella lapillus]